MHVGEEINLSTSCWQVHSMICTALVMRVMCCWDYTALHISTTTHGQVYTRPWIWEFENLRITLHSKLLQLREPLSYVTVNIRIGPLFVFPVTVYRATPRTRLPLIMAWVIDAQSANVDKLTTCPPHMQSSFLTYSWLHLNYTELICADFIWTDLISFELTWFVLLPLKRLGGGLG